MNKRAIFTGVVPVSDGLNLLFSGDLEYRKAITTGLQKLNIQRPQAMAEFLAEVNNAARKLMSHLDATQEQRPMQIYVPFALADKLVKMAESTSIDVSSLISLKLSEGTDIDTVPLRPLTADEIQRLSKYEQAAAKPSAAPGASVIEETSSPEDFLVTRKDIQKMYMFAKRADIESDKNFDAMQIRLSPGMDIENGEVILKHLTIVCDTEGFILTKFDEINSLRDMGNMHHLTVGDCYTGVELNGGNAHQLKLAMSQDMAQSVLDELIDKYNWKASSTAAQAKLHEALAHSFMTNSPQAFFYLQEGYHGVDINSNLSDSLIFVNIVMVDSTLVQLESNQRFINYDVQNIDSPDWINPMSQNTLACFSALEGVLENSGMATMSMAVQRAYMRMLNAPALAKAQDDEVEASSD